MSFGVLLFQYTTFCSHKNSHLWVPDTSEKNLHNVKLSILETIVGIETTCTYDKAIHIPFSVSRFNGFQRYTAAPNKDGRPLKTCPNGVRRLGVQKVLTSIHPRWMCCSVQKRTLWGVSGSQMFHLMWHGEMARRGSNDRRSHQRHPSASWVRIEPTN